MWVAERSSGYDGMRNTETGEWIYFAEWEKRHQQNSTNKLKALLLAYYKEYNR